MTNLISYWFDTSGQFDINPDDIVIGEDDNDSHETPKYCCAVCNNRITAETASTTVGGQHRHAKTNPQGRTYVIRCFTTAPGCFTTGTPTSYFSWFSGYVWSFAHCAQCQAQMGWFFQGTDSFFGLLAEQIKYCDNPNNMGKR